LKAWKRKGFRLGGLEADGFQAWRLEGLEKHPLWPAGRWARALERYCVVTALNRVVAAA
jgi:hypothetical protein